MKELPANDVTNKPSLFATLVLRPCRRLRFFRRLDMKFCKYFANKKTALVSLGSIGLYAVGGPSPMIASLFLYGIYSYHSFLDETIKEQTLANMERALNTLDVDQLKKLGIRSPHELGNKKDNFLKAAIHQKNKNVLYWVVETDDYVDTLLIFYNQFKSIFLERLSSCSNGRKYFVLQHLVLKALHDDPDCIPEMIAMNEMLALDILNITCHHYENRGSKQELLSLMKRYETYFIESNWVPNSFFHLTESNDLEYLLKHAPVFLVRKIADHYLLETKISKADRQRRVDMFLKCGFNFSLYPDSTADLPADLKNATYRTLLSHFYVVIKSDPQFIAIRNQKILALAFGLKGKSRMGQEEIGHAYLVDPEVYWEHLVSFYKENAEIEKKHLNPEMVDFFEETVSRLPLDHAAIDYEKTLENFNRAMPVVLPIYLSAGYGELHIASVGFLKIKSPHYLRVEADKGLGRKEFCVYRVEGDVRDVLSEYTYSKNHPYNSYRWATIRSDKEKKILSEPLSPQKDNFCSRISAEYAFQIVFFLSMIKSTLTDGDTLSSDKEMDYYVARTWFKCFKLRHQKKVLENYRLQDIAYQNVELFFLAKKHFEKHEKQISLRLKNKKLTEVCSPS